MSIIANTNLEVPVELVEVKDLGLSDRDESKSLIEVRWTVNPIYKDKIISFNLVLSITYAVGTTIHDKQSMDSTSLSAQIEVPSVKTIGGKATAFIKNIDARVTAVISTN